MLGGLLGGLSVLCFYAPATWLASGVFKATQGQVQLQQARGTVWNGSAPLVLTGGQGSADAAALTAHGVGVEELQRRLLEFGFVDGAHIEVIHEGAIGRDPIAVRLDDMRVALRRRDAEDIYILLDGAKT